MSVMEAHDSAATVVCVCVCELAVSLVRVKDPIASHRLAYSTCYTWFGLGGYWLVNLLANKQPSGFTLPG